MKKIIALLLVALMAVSFAACATNNEPVNATENTTVINTEANSDSDNANESDSQNTAAPALEIDINDANANRTVFDDKNIKITMEAVTADKGLNIPFVIENNSDTDLYVTGGHFCVNNIVFPSFASVDVKKGETGTTDISVNENDLKDCRINEIGIIEFRLSIADKASYSDVGSTGDVKLIVNKDVDITPAPVGDMIFSTDGLKIYNEPSITESEVYEYFTRFMFVNESNKELTVNIKDTTVNGTAIEPNFLTMIPAGKIIFTDLMFSKSDLASNNITAIDEAQFKFDICDRNNREDNVISDTITIKAN